jgi:hypothetical protein
MMPDLFQMTLRLDGESMNDFGRAVARVCIEYPEAMLSDIRDLQANLTAKEPDVAALEAILDRMSSVTRSTVQIGDGLATLIGMCQPERIDGGPLQ